MNGINASEPATAPVTVDYKKVLDELIIEMEQATEYLELARQDNDWNDVQWFEGMLGGLCICQAILTRLRGV